MKVDTDAKKIKTILSRGVETLFPNEKFLKERLESGKQLTLYLGIDPTGPTLHLGHTIALRKLAQFQELGHKIILLIGDFTARIGDPTDKGETRKQLTKEEVLENAKLYQQQAALFLDFDGKNAAELRYNGQWLDAMNFADVLELASRVTVGQMLERDMFKKRMQQGQPIAIHEFMYPLMQGYDSVAMDVDGEVGGNDQTFNMLVGRDLQKQINGKEKFVVPMKLLTDTSGAKMGKTTGNMLSFLDDANEKFGKVMSWTDGMILPGFELCTDVDLAPVEKRLRNGENPRDLKMELAFEITRTFHGPEEALKAKENFITQFSQQSVPEDLNEYEIDESDEHAVLDLLQSAGFISSNKEGRRKLQEGAVQLNGKKVKELKLKIPKELLEKGVVLKLGRKMIKIKKKQK